MSSEEAIFNRNGFSDIDSEASLRVLSNCVTLVNCTILRERKLIPADWFKPFRVFGDINGYILDETNAQTEAVSRKMSSMSSAIRNKKIYKLALFVEEDLHTSPTEAFVWKFSYDGRKIRANMGHNEKQSAFQADAKDMEHTCRSFCKFFSDLQDILKSLRPLPSGMISSLRAAYREDPEFVVGFHSVKGFPDVRKIDLKTVVFPHKHSFHLSYASNFTAEVDTNYSHLCETDLEILNERIPSDETSASPRIETTRRQTMGFAESGDTDLSG